MKKLAKLGFAALALCAMGAQAETAVGTLENVTGAVSIGGKGLVTKATNGMALVNGSTVLVSSKGKATVVLANGCAIALQGSQHLTVNAALPCEQSIASIKHLAKPVQLAQALLEVPPAGSSTVTGAGVAPGAAGGLTAAGGLGTGAALAGFGVLAGILTLDAATNDKTSGS